MNFFPGQIVAKDGGQYQIKLDSGNYVLAFTPKVAADAQGAKEGDRVTVGFRPEHLQIAPGPSEGQVRGRVRIIQHLGQVVRYEVALEDGGRERAIEVDMRLLVPGVLEGDEIAVQFPQDVGFLFAEGGEE